MLNGFGKVMWFLCILFFYSLLGCVNICIYKIKKLYWQCLLIFFWFFRQLSTGVPYPNLFYTGNADDVINADDISDSYTLSPTMTIPFLAAVYSLEGKYLHTVPLTGSLLQLCNTDQTTADAAYIFGTYYSKSVINLPLWHILL